MDGWMVIAKGEPLPEGIRKSIIPAAGPIQNSKIKEDGEVLETEKRMIGTVPVLELRGRFDGHGAAVFEQEVESLDPETCSLVLFEKNIIPYFIALLEWTYPIVSYRNATLLQKRFAAYSAGLIVQRIMELE